MIRQPLIYHRYSTFTIRIFATKILAYSRVYSKSKNDYIELCMYVCMYVLETKAELVLCEPSCGLLGSPTRSLLK